MGEGRALWRLRVEGKCEVGGDVEGETGRLGGLNLGLTAPWLQRHAQTHCSHAQTTALMHRPTAHMPRSAPLRHPTRDQPQPSGSPSSAFVGIASLSISGTALPPSHHISVPPGRRGIWQLLGLPPPTLLLLQIFISLGAPA